MCGSRAVRRLVWLPLLLLLAPVLGPAGVPVFGARVLAVAPLRPARHSRELRPLVRALAARVHHLSLMSHFARHQQPPSHTHFSLVNSTEDGSIPAPFLLEAHEGVVCTVPGRPPPPTGGELGGARLRPATLRLSCHQLLLIHAAAVALVAVLLALMSVYAGLRWILGPFLVGSAGSDRN